MVDTLTRWCCVCKTAEIDGVLIPRGKYSEEGRTFSDGIFSKECFKNFYANEFSDEQISRMGLNYVSCKTIVREN